jgi:hypothetical protein
VRERSFGSHQGPSGFRDKGRTATVLRSIAIVLQDLGRSMSHGCAVRKPPVSPSRWGIKGVRHVLQETSDRCSSDKDCPGCNGVLRDELLANPERVSVGRFPFQAGLMFWFSRKKFVGSYFFLISLSL